MDWESFLGLIGLYILAIVILYHQFIMTRRIIHLTSTIKDILTNRQKLIMKRTQEKTEGEMEGQEAK
ncbi:MAG: hypothetical protein V3T58_03220 [Candidatus Hydrothermarchaeales archaeon]